MTYTCILWDVDGTLIDGSDGILNRLTTVLTQFGYPAPDRTELSGWIGPPMFDSFQHELGMSATEAAEAVTRYRMVTKDYGYVRDTRLYPGVAELIAEIAASGTPQATASSKPHGQLLTLMEHYQLTEYFAAIVGATPDEKTLAAKTDIVAEALRQLAASGADLSRPVLVGDRHHDVVGGSANGIPVIFVRWGFSKPGEAEGAAAVAQNADELRQLLR